MQPSSEEQLYAKHQYPRKFKVLYRIVRCLDCVEDKFRKDNDCISLMTTISDVNKQIKAKINVLDQKGFTLTQICQELKMVYGNHVIANRADRFTRTNMDY